MKLADRRVVLLASGLLIDAHLVFLDVYHLIGREVQASESVLMPSRLSTCRALPLQEGLWRLILGALMSC